jgi:hypothetical protein
MANMSKELHRRAQNETLAYLQAHGIADHMVYGPIGDRYWTESIRVVALNLEPWGYNGCGVVRVNEGELRRWFDDGKSKRSKTVSCTLTLMSVILARVESGRPPSRDAFIAAYRDRQLLEDTLLRTTYYNIRPDSNSRKAQDFAAIAAVGRTELGRLIWSEIRALDPHVLLVSGRAGLIALNALLALEKPIGFRDHLVHPDGFFIHSIVHPSRPRYTQWVSAVEAIGSWMEKLPNSPPLQTPGSGTPTADAPVAPPPGIAGR